MKSLKLYFLSLSVLALSAVTANAQIGFSAGMTAGVSTGAVKISRMDTSVINIVEGRQISGFEGGFYARINILPFYIKPQVMYGFRSGEVKVTTAADRATTTEKFSMQKLEFPLFLGVRIAGPLSIEAGPVYNYITVMTKQFDGTELKTGNNAIGYRAGLALDFERFFINANFQGATYSSAPGEDKLKEPYKVTLGLGIALIGKSTK